MSRRKDIRHLVVAVLKSTVTGVSERVFPSRPQAVGADELPCLCVYTRSEDIETIENTPQIQERTLNLVVEILCKGSANLDDVLDDLAEAVENALLSGFNDSPNGVFYQPELESTEMGFLEAAKPIGAARMNFIITFGSTF